METKKDELLIEYERDLMIFKSSLEIYIYKSKEFKNNIIFFTDLINETYKKIERLKKEIKDKENYGN